MNDRKQITGLRCVITVLLAASLILSACTASPTPIADPSTTHTATETPSRRGAGDVLKVSHPQAPDSLNPHLSVSLKDLEPARIVYEPLASFDKEGNLVPFLAVEIPSLENGGVSADGKSVTWKLRRDILWSDGKPFTANDVLFTFQYVTNPDVGAVTSFIYMTVQDVQVIDPYTVKVNFIDVTPAWFTPFIGASGLIIPEHIFKDYNSSNAREAPANVLPVGTGPYRVLEPGIKPQEVLLMGSQLIPTNKIVFEPNPYFRDPDKPYFRRIEWRGGGTANDAAIRVLRDGDIDMAFDLGQLEPDLLTQLANNGKGVLVVSFGSVIDRILLNRTDPNSETADGERSSLQFPHPFFSDKRVRQAFAHAIDRQAIADLYGPLGRPAINNLVVPPQFASPNIFYPYDLDKASQLLVEAGWIDTNGDNIRDKDGRKLKVVYQVPTGAIYQKVQQIVKAALESIGVEVELKIVDPLIIFGPGDANPDSAFRFNADLQELEISLYSPDPTDYMLFWTCDRIPQKSNNWEGYLNLERWCNPEYDALAMMVATELDPQKRAEIFIKMNDLLIEDVVMIPVVHRADAAGVNLSILGVDLSPWDMYTWNIMDWSRTTP
jgi:peptide/nickel transport system substrate-binding protein